MSQQPLSSQPVLPMRLLRQRQREQRASLILRVAQEVFADKGYYDASMDEIAARAGIAKGTVYLHFAGKEDLLAALAAQQITEFLERMDQVRQARTSVRERLDQIFLDVFTRMQERRNQVLLELHNSMGLTQSVIKRRGDLQARLSRALEHIGVLLEEGKRTGELDRTVPTSIMLATFVTLLSPTGYEQLLTSGQIAPAELVTYVRRIFFPPVGEPPAPNA
ncbi:MAG TPA: helix-turn-helix domain-containing protein [Chloroflexia bacterium]|nr:helix-turn-helix domain-containing protein [Chloroflexia bacterium]